MTVPILREYNRSLQSDPKFDATIKAASKDPWLSGMELARHGTKTACFVGFVGFEDLYWDDEGVLQKVIEDKSIEDID
jgi:hypothetical protein